MDKKNNMFKRPKSMLGKRKPRASLTSLNDSRLETISETCPTPSTSRQNNTIGEESFNLGYDSLCDDTFRTPLSNKTKLYDHFKTPLSNLKSPSSVVDSHKKSVSRILNRPSKSSLKNICLQTSKHLDQLETPPFVLKKRLRNVTSAFHDLEEEYNELKEFTSLEKQVLSVEGLSELQIENKLLKEHINFLAEEKRVLKDKIESAEEIGLFELKEENEKLKIQIQLNNEDAGLFELREENEKLKNQLLLNDNTAVTELREENEKLKNLLQFNDGANFENLLKEHAELQIKFNSLTENFNSVKNELSKITAENKKLLKDCELAKNKLVDIEITCEAKEAKWSRRELELTTSLEELKESSNDHLGSIGENRCSCKILLDEEEYKLIQTSLNEKIKILNNLQDKISTSESSFVALFDDKNTVISQLSEKIKSMSKHFNLWSDKIKSLESTILTKDDETLHLKKQLDSIRNYSTQYISRLQDCLRMGPNSFGRCNEDFVNHILSFYEILMSNEIISPNLVEGIDINIPIYCHEFNRQISEVDKNESGKVIEDKDLSRSEDKFMEEIKEKDTKIEDLMTNLKLKDTEIENLLNILNQMNVDLLELPSELRANDTLTMIKNIKKLLTENDLRIAELSSVMNKQNFEIDNLHSDLAGEKASINEMSRKHKTEILELVNEKISLEKELSEAVEKVVSLKSTCLDRDSKLGIIKRELDQSFALLQNVASTLSLTQRSQEENNEQQQKLIKNLSCQVDSLNNNINNLNMSLLHKEEQLDNLKIKMDFLENEKCQYKNRLHLFASVACDSEVIGESFEEILNMLEAKFTALNDLIEHHKNVIFSKEEVFMRRLRDHELSKKRILSSETELQRKLSLLESSYSDSLSKALNEIREIKVSNDSQINNLETFIDELKKQLELKSNEVYLKDAQLLTLGEELEEFEKDRTNFFCQLSAFDPAYGSQPSDFNNTLKCLVSKFDQYTNLIEHLRNVIFSKDEKLKLLSNEMYSVKISELEKGAKERIISLENCIMSIKDTVHHYGSVSNELLCQHLIQVISDCDFNQVSKDKMLHALEKTFSENNDLNESFKNITQVLESDNISSSEVDKHSSERFPKENSALKMCQENLGASAPLSTLEAEDCQENECSMTDKISCLEDQLKLSSVELKVFKDSLSAILNITDNKTTDELLDQVQKYFSDFMDLKEHFKNTIQSKDDQIVKHTQCINDKLSLLSETESQITLLSNKLADCETEITSYKDIALLKAVEVSALQNTVSTLEGQFNITFTEFSSFKESLCKILNNIECDSSDELLEHVQNSLSVVHDLNEHLKNTIQSKDDQINKLMECIVKKQHLNSESKAQITSLSKELSECFNELNSCKDSDLLKTDEMRKLKEEVRSLESQLSLNSTEFNSLKKSLCSLFNNPGFKSLEELLEHIKNSLTDFHDINEHLKNIIQSKDDQINKAMEFVVKKQCLIAKMEVEMSSLSKQLSSCQTDLSYHTNNGLFMTNKISALNEKNVCLENQLSLKSDELNFLKESLCCMLNNIQFNSSKELIEHAQNTLSDMHDLNEHLNNIIQSKDEQIGKLKDKISNEQSLSSEVSALSKDLSDCRNELVVYQQSDNLKIIEISSLNDKIMRLEDQSLKNSSELNLLKHSLIVLLKSDESKTLNELIESVQKSFYDLLDLKEHLKNIIQSKDEQISKLVVRSKANDTESKLMVQKNETDHLRAEDKITLLESNMDYQERENKNWENELKFSNLKQYQTERYSEIVRLRTELETLMGDFNGLNEHANNNIGSLQQQLFSLITEFGNFIMKSSVEINIIEDGIMKNTDELRHCHEMDKDLLKFQSIIIQRVAHLEEKVKHSINVEEKLHTLYHSVESLRNITKNELTQALEALDNYDLGTEQLILMNVEYEGAIEDLSSRISSFNEERSIYFKDLQHCLWKYGLNSGEIRTFNEALSMVTHKLNEFVDLKDHLKNLIQSKEEKLRKIVSKTTIDCNSGIDICKQLEVPLENEADYKSDGNSLQTNHLDICLSIISELSSSLQIKPFADISNYEEILNTIKIKYIELNDLTEHLRNIIYSQNDKISAITNFVKSNKNIDKNTSEYIFDLCNQSCDNIGQENDNFETSISATESSKNVDQCKLFNKVIVENYNLNSTANECDILVRRESETDIDFAKDNKIVLLETQLSNTLLMLDECKANEIAQCNEISELKKQLEEVHGSLSEKINEIIACKESLDCSLECNNQLLKEKELFLCRLINSHASFSNITDFENLLTTLENKNSELTDIIVETQSLAVSKEKVELELQTKIKLVDELTEKIEGLDHELISLRKLHESTQNQLEDYKNKQTSEELLSELDFFLTDMIVNSGLIKVEECEISVVSFKNNISHIFSHILKLTQEIQLLDEQLKTQISFGLSNEDFIEKFMADISGKVEFTKELVSNLCSQLFLFKVHDETDDCSDFEMEKHYKEEYSNILIYEEALSVMENQDEMITYLLKAWRELEVENGTLISESYSVLQDCYDLDCSVINETVKISNDCLLLVQHVINGSRQLCSFNLEEIVAQVNNSFIDFINMSSDLIDPLFNDVYTLLKYVPEDIDCIVDCNNESISSLLNNLRHCPVMLEELVLFDVPKDDVSDCFILFKLLDSICVENKLIDTLANSMIKSASVKNESYNYPLNSVITEAKKTERFPDKVMDRDISLLMTVTDQTVLDTSQPLDCSNQSLIKENEVYDKTMYILPEGQHNTSDSRLERTLYLNNAKVLASMAEDPLNTIDTTLSSSYPHCDWLKFDSKFKENSYLEDSINEFHDAKDSINISFNAREANTFKEQPEEMSSKQKLDELVCLLGISESEDFMTEICNIISSVNSIKGIARDLFPDIAEKSFDNIFRELCNKCSSLERNESLISSQYDLLLAKYKSLYASTQLLQESAKEVRNIHQKTSSDLELYRNQIGNNISLLSKAFIDNHEAVNKHMLESRNQSNDYKNLKHLYNECMRELEKTNSLKSKLEKSLEVYEVEREDIALKNQELLTEKNSMMFELNDLQSHYEKIKDEVKQLKHLLEVLESEKISHNTEVSNLQINVASLETTVKMNTEMLEQLRSEKASLLMEIGSLKDKISIQCSEDAINKLNCQIEDQTSKLNNVESAYNILRKNYDDLLTEFTASQKKAESNESNNIGCDVSLESIVEGLRLILRTLDLDDEFDLKDELLPTFNKIIRRLNLLKECNSALKNPSVENDSRELIGRIKSLESDLQDANTFKCSFATELHSLKPELRFNDLLRKPFAELHTIMITEIMTRENIIITDLKTECDRKVTALKEDLHQMEGKDKRRAQWVLELENDNEQLNAQTRQLKEDIKDINNKLNSKKLSEKIILKELSNLEKKLNHEPFDSDEVSDNDKNFMKTNSPDEVLMKLLKLSKSVLPYESVSPSSRINQYKETIKCLESECLSLKEKNDLLELSQKDSSQENKNLKAAMDNKVELYENQITSLNRKIKEMELSLSNISQKLVAAEQCIIQEQEYLKREKNSSLKALHENKIFKEQLESQLENEIKLSEELTKTKNSLEIMMSNHREELASQTMIISKLECELANQTMTVSLLESKLANQTMIISNLESELANRTLIISKLESELAISSNSCHEKRKLESELVQTKVSLADLKQEHDLIVSSLEAENKNLKNDINMKSKEIALLLEEHKLEVVKLKESLNETVSSNLALKTLLEESNYKLSNLESNLCEKESVFRDNVSKLLKERENDFEKNKKLEELVLNNQKTLSELENQVLEKDQINQILEAKFEQNSSELLLKLNILEGQKNALELTIDSLKKASEEKEMINLREKDSLKDQIKKYVTKISQLDQQLNFSKTSNSSSSAFNYELLKLFPEFPGCSEDLLAHIKIKMAAIESLNEELEDKRTECKYLEEECDQLVDKIKSFEKRIGEVCRAQFEDEVKYKSEIKEKSSRIVDLENQISFSKSELIKKSEEMGQISKTVDSLREEVVGVENKLKEAKIQLSNLTEENISLRNRVAPKLLNCVKCEQLTDKLVHYKAKLKVKEVMVAELSAKTEASSTPLKERNSLLEKYKDRISELEVDNSRLKALEKVDHKEDNPELQIQNVAKLKARITKLEKDREFLKRLCEKRAATILSLKQGET